MSRRKATLLALGAGVVVLAAVAVLVAWRPWQSRSTPRPAVEAPTDFVTILSVSQEQLRSVEFTSRAAVVELTQTDGVWRMARPAALAVKRGPLNDILYSLANLVSERVVDESPASLVPYGLDPPSVTIRATLTTGVVRVLYLGDRTPAADSYYLMAQGDPRVFTVREHHGTYFQYTLADFWELQRTPIDGSDIVALRIEQEGEPYLEIRRTEDLYRRDPEFRGTTLSVIHPWAEAPKPVDLTFLTAFVTSFARLQAEAAVDADPQDPASYGLDRPAHDLEIVDATGNRLHVAVGNPRGRETYLLFEDDPVVYAGDPGLLDVLNVDPFQFVSKYAAIIRLDHVDRLTITAGSLRHVLEIRRPNAGTEDDAEWLVDGRRVATQAFKDFYTFAISLQIDALSADLVSGAPELSMVYVLNTSPRAFTVEFIPQSSEFYAVTKNGAGDILVNRQQVRALLRRLEELAASAGG